MAKDENRKLITARDVAKFVGVEKEYDDLLFEKELQQAYDTIMSEDRNELGKIESID